MQEKNLKDATDSEREIKDESIVTILVYKADYRHPEVTILANAAGSTEILIKDEKGKTAKLYVTVVE